MSAISRESLTPLRSCCKTFSEKTRALAAWCMASQAFRSAPRSSWKSFSRLPGNSPGKAEVNDAAFCLVSLDPVPAGPLRSISGFTDAGIISIAGPSSRRQRPVEHPVFYRTAEIDGLSIFYREAGEKDAPVLFLL